MSSELLGSAHNVLKGNLGGAWDINKGYADAYTDLGIARRFGGSAAAYSLRDIGAMNGRVVKVRRDVDGQGTDPEEDFSANQVASGALEDFVNGKLEGTLPADVATAAAAFSLRKVKSSYSDNAVRIRRLADDTEVNVAFDSDDKVSTSSSISAVSGSTNATDLNGFLNEQIELINQDFSTDTTGFTNLTSGSNTAARITSDGFSSSTSLQLDFVDSTNTYNTPRTSLKMIDFDGATYTIRFYAKAVSGSADLRIRIGTGDIVITVDYDDNGGEWKQYTQTFVNDGGQQAGDFRGRSLTFFPTSGVATVWRIDNFELIQEDNHSARVHTWYDQAGSNDAVQATAGNQPQIANNGALLADGVDFDGSNDFLDATSALGATATIGAFMVHKPDDTDENQYLIDNRDSTSDGMRIMQRSENDGNYRFSMDSTDVNSASGSVTTNETLLTAIQSSTAATLFKNAVQQATDADDAIDVTAAFRIGANRVSTGTYFDGTMKEIILFTSDQTDNRFKIESNINNYYGLYNDGRDVTGDFVNSGQGTFLSSSITDDELNFDYDPADTSEFFGIQLANNVVDGDEIFISFNGTGGFNPLVLLRHTSPIGGNISDIKTGLDAAGFQSFKLTCNSTNSNDSFLVFNTRANPSGSYNVTNLKISRIARDGFVETWYDQSSNGNDATQATASKQPKIVSNGGLSPDGLEFDGSDDVLVSTSFSATQPITSLAVFKSSNTSDSQTVVGGVSYNYIIHRAGGAATAGLNAGTLYAPFSSITTKQLMTTLANGTSSRVAQNGSLSSAGDAGTNNQTDLGIGSNGNGGTAGSGSAKFDGNIEEVIIFDADKTSDRTEIERDIANYYNITLS